MLPGDPALDEAGSDRAEAVLALQAAERNGSTPTKRTTSNPAPPLPIVSGEFRSPTPSSEFDTPFDRVSTPATSPDCDSESHEAQLQKPTSSSSSPLVPSTTPPTSPALAGLLLQHATYSHPPFPSPSSTFRAAPETESVLLSNPPTGLLAAAHVASRQHKERALDRISISSSTSGTHTPTSHSHSNSLSSPTLPARPLSRPPSRPGSFSVVGGGGRNRSGSSVSRISNLGSPCIGERGSPRLGDSSEHGEQNWLPTPVLASSLESSGGTFADVDSPTTPKTPSIAIKSPATSPSSTSRAGGKVIVRDFAFELEDPRFIGLRATGQWQSSSVASSSKSRNEDLLGNEAFASSGSSAYSWGFVTSHETDFPAEDDSQLYSEDELDELPIDFVRGIYLALFDFSPELDTEMPMIAGDVVSVFARKCAGWVTGGKVLNGQLTGEVGLIPENYLQLLERDEDQDEYSDEEEEESTSDGDAREENRSEEEDAATPRGEPVQERESTWQEKEEGEERER